MPRLDTNLLAIPLLALSLAACATTPGADTASLPAADFDYVGWDQ